MSDRLEEALADLGRSLDTGPVPDVVPAVIERLAAPPPHRSRRWWVRGGAVAVVVAALFGLVPGAAGAVADFFESLPGVLFSRTEEPPPPSPGPVDGPLGMALGLSGRIPLESAGVTVSAAVGAPAEVYRGDGVITMLWPVRPDLPAIGPSGIGLIVDVIEADLGPYAEKMLAAPPERFVLDGSRAAWVAEPHTLVVLHGVYQPVQTRLAVRTLVVSKDRFTLRVESLLDKEGSIAIARSVG